MYTIAKNTADRLKRFNALDANTLYHPPLLADRLRSGGQENYILSVSRLETVKRVDLLIKALKFVDEPMDLIVVGAFFGKGRRTGRYGTLLLSTYDSENDTFPSICKVGTGFTDESLDQLYQILSPTVSIKKNSRVESDMDADVWFDPNLVIEIVASEITLSPIHKTAYDVIRKNSGIALRFPKFTGKIRTEKHIEDASTDEEVIALYKSQKKSI